MDDSESWLDFSWTSSGTFLSIVGNFGFCGGGAGADLSGASGMGGSFLAGVSTLEILDVLFLALAVGMLR